MTKYSFLQWKEFGRIAVLCGLTLGAIFEVCRAIFKGVIDAPLGPLHSIVLISYHEHPLWFLFCFLVFSVTGVLLPILLFLIIRGELATVRNINKKFPMTNRWTGRS